MSTESLLEIKREWNNLNQNIYNDKTNLLRDTDKAETRANNMRDVNAVVEKMEIWPEIREMDSKLSSLYTLRNWLEKIKKSAANYEKKL